jgi:lysozyme
VILSEAGLAAIERREAVRLGMYYDAKGLPTIGVGHLLTTEEIDTGLLHIAGIDVHWRNGLTEREAADLLRQDAAQAEAVVNHCVRVPLSQNQFDSLASFVFNIGGSRFIGSTLLRQLNADQFATVPGELRQWVYVGHQVNDGLVTRRESEVAQWEGTA